LGGRMVKQNVEPISLFTLRISRRRGAKRAPNGKRCAGSAFPTPKRSKWPLNRPRSRSGTRTMRCSFRQITVRTSEYQEQQTLVMVRSDGAGSSNKSGREADVEADPYLRSRRGRTLELPPLCHPRGCALRCDGDACLHRSTKKSFGDISTCASEYRRTDRVDPTFVLLT